MISFVDNIGETTMTMRHILYIVIILCALHTAVICGEKNELKWTTFKDGIEQAKKGSKRVLVDVYTDWCGWCKRMDRDVYTNRKVAQYLDSQFVLVKLNAESSTSLNYDGKQFTEMSLASYFGITGYPTTVFLEADGKVIAPVAGYIEANTFLDITHFIGDGLYQKMSWEQFQSQNTHQGKN